MTTQKRTEEDKARDLEMEISTLVMRARIMPQDERRDTYRTIQRKAAEYKTLTGRHYTNWHPEES